MSHKVYVNMRRAMQRACTAAVFGLCACAGYAQDLMSPVLTSTDAPFYAADVYWISEFAKLDDERRQLCVDVLEGSRIAMLSAQRELELARWLNEISQNEQDEDKRRKLISEKWLVIFRKFCDRREKIEREFLTDLRAASGASDEEWRRYEQRRRFFTLRLAGEYALIDIHAITRSLGLSSVEQSAVDVAMRELEETIEPYIRQYMKLAVRRNVLSQELEEVSDYDNSKYKPMYEEYYALATQKGVESQKIAEAMLRTAKTIAGELTSEHAAEFQSRINVTKLQALASMLRFLDDPVISDLLRISTLTKEQRSAMRSLMRRTQNESMVHFKDMLNAYEQWAVGKEPSTEIDYDAMMTKHQKIIRDLREKMIGELTSDQRSAFEEGVEPPLSWRARRSGEEVERAR
jgi:hypothetical protein